MILKEQERRFFSLIEASAHLNLYTLSQKNKIQINVFSLGLKPTCLLYFIYMSLLFAKRQLTQLTRFKLNEASVSCKHAVKNKYFYTTTSIINEKRRESLLGGGKVRQDAQHAKVSYKPRVFE